MGSISYRNILRRVRITSARMPWRKILTFSFFVLLSTIFWFLQIYRQSFVATYTIPVKYTSIPDDIVFETPLPQVIDVTIKDNGYALFKYYFIKRNDTLKVDVSKMINISTNKVLQTSALQQLLSGKFFQSSTIINHNPLQISFLYSALKHKKIPVVFDGQIFLASGYLLNGDIQVVPDSVMAYGSENALHTLNYSYTTSDTINDFSSQSPLIFEIKHLHNIKFVPNKVQVNVPIDKYTQKELSIPVTCINVPDNLNAKFFPSSVKVSFLVGLSKFPTISDFDFSVQLDYNDLKDVEGFTVPLRITSSPNYIQNLALSPTEVEFILEQK